MLDADGILTRYKSGFAILLADGILTRDRDKCRGNLGRNPGGNYLMYLELHRGKERTKDGHGFFLRGGLSP
jgi:hypothetical protein